MTINYYFEGSSIMLAEPYVVQVPSGEPYFRPSPPLDKFTLVDTNQGMVSGTATADRTINVYYRYAYDVVPYTVEYYQRNPSTLNYQLAQTETLYGRINETVNFRDKYFSGYYLVTEDPTLLITGDSPVKKLYYELTDMNYVIFRTGGSYIAPITAMAGANIADLAKARDKIHPTRQGYNFVRWDWEGHIPSTMPSQDLVVNAVWEPAQSKFNIIHWKQNTARNGYVIAENELVGGLTEATASSVGHTKNYPGFEFVHEDSGVVITADNTAVINFYYDRVMWSHDVYVKGVKVTTLSGYYGTPMTLPTEAQILAWGNYSATDYYAVGFRNESGTIVGYATPYVFGSAGTNRSDLVATEGDLTDTENTIFKKSKFPPHEIIITYYVETIDSPIANPDWQQTEVVRWVKFPAASMLVQVLHPPGLTAKSYNNGTSSYWAMGSATVGGQKVATFTSNGESGVRMRRNLYKLTYYNPFDGDKVEFPDQKFEKP
ncbi:MAG: hypothetical protein LBN02_07305, partial [Oscillospiraceae bacterium]|nr:hypothetical protein [Oscillospiraceae bacterium]